MAATAVPKALETKERVALARASLAFYIGWAHRTDMPEASSGMAVPRAHHLRIISRMEQVAEIVLRQGDWAEASQERHTSVIAPPGSAKTTLLQGFYEWLLGRASLVWGENWADMLHLGHVSHSAEQAWRMSYAVRQTVEHSDVFHACFPKVKPSEKWAEHEWRVEGCTGQHPTMVAMGINGPLLGVRLNLLGLDDTIKPEDVRESKVSTVDVEQIIYKIDKVGMKRLVDGGCAWMNHTRWFERDPPAWASEQGWTELLIPALDERDESFWPERQIFSTETLKAERARDPEGFALQFMGLPAPAEGIIFRQQYFGDRFDQLPWADSIEKLSRFQVVASADTAGTTNPRSDYTAVWTAAIDFRSWDIYLLNLFHDKIDYNDLLDTLRGMFYSALIPQIMWVEDKATGQPAAQQLRYREGLNIVPVKPYGERGQPRLLDVINQVQPMLATGRIHFPSERFAVAHGLSWLGDALTALLRYPRGRHDDIARAFIQLLYETLKLQQHAGIWEHELAQIGWADTYDRKARV